MKKVLFSGFILIMIASCSTKRATFLGKQYHALTSEYNILFHGKENLQKGIEELKNKNESDFYRELSLEGIEFDDKIYLPGQSRSEFLNKAEEKAGKAVQKHSMEIRGVEHNSRMDEAMLLLGMSRYYDQRYLAAMDAFNYALDNYYDTDLRDELLLWRSKTLLKLGNTKLARKKLLEIGGNATAKPDTKAWAYAFVAESFREDGQPNDTVARFLSRAARLAKNKKLRHTLAYKAAQVWEKTGQKDSAIAMTHLILKNKNPEKFILYTRLYQIHLTKNDTSSHEKNIKFLQRHLKNYYFNRNFPDFHYRLAEIYLVEKDTLTAIRHFSQAAKATNKSLKKLAYQQLADIYWNEKNYLNTGKYLDSILQVMNKNTLQYLLVSQRRRSIDKIVQWEELIQRNDSLLQFIKLDSAEQVKKIQAYIEKLQQKKEEKILKKQSGSTQQTFYFYNPQQVQNGKEEFKKRWGDRKLEDLWRLSNKYGTAEETRQTQKIDVTETKKVPDSLQVEFYLKQLPQTPGQIDSIKQEIVKAHLYLGINYANEKFKEYKLAEKNLQYVLKSNPTPPQKEQAYYVLYKIYTHQGQTEKRNYYKEKLSQEFPQSPYVQLILHPEEKEAIRQGSFEKTFRQAYQSYQNQKYNEALNLTKKAVKKFAQHPDLPKFLFLLGRLEGKLHGIDAYINQLNEIKKRYPGTTYAEQAKNIIKNLQFLKIKYARPPDKFPYFIVFVLNQPEQAIPLKKCLEDIYAGEKGASQYFFKDTYDEKTDFLVTGDFLSENSALYILEKLKAKCKFPPYFIISREKYINLQLNKQPLPLNQKN